MNKKLILLIIIAVCILLLFLKIESTAIASMIIIHFSIACLLYLISFSIAFSILFTTILTPSIILLLQYIMDGMLDPFIFLSYAWSVVFILPVFVFLFFLKKITGTGSVESVSLPTA